MDPQQTLSRDDVKIDSNFRIWAVEMDLLSNKPFKKQLLNKKNLNL